MDRSPRLAELVVHLTGCNPEVAVVAVDTATEATPENVDDALLIVARAMCTIHHVDLTEPVDLRDKSKVTSL